MAAMVNFGFDLTLVNIVYNKCHVLPGEIKETNHFTNMKSGMYLRSSRCMYAYIGNINLFFR